MSNFKESDHPRDSDGKFTPKGVSGYTDKVNERIAWAKANKIDLPLNVDGSVNDIELQRIQKMSAAELSKALRREVSTGNALTISRKPVKIVMLPKDIYAEFDSVIRTRYGNKIPKYGYVMLHNPIKRYNFFLLFNHDDHSDRNVCTCKLDLDRDADLINDYLERFIRCQS